MVDCWRQFKAIETNVLCSNRLENTIFDDLKLFCLILKLVNIATMFSILPTSVCRYHNPTYMNLKQIYVETFV